MDQTPVPVSDITTKASQIASDIQVITTGVAQAVTIVSKLSTWTAICGFFTALPGLVSLILQLIEVFKVTPAQKIMDIANAMTLASKAKTVQEKTDAAKILANS